ncbi:MAG: C-terminal helicase domain-containing protein [Caldilineaceae bacterium]
MVEELLDAGDRSLIFTQFTEMGGYLQSFLQQRFGRPVLFLHGQVSPPNGDRRWSRRFQDETGGPPIFVLSLKAGGTGLNLTRASHVFHFDRWWNPAVEDQATDRTPSASARSKTYKYTNSSAWAPWKKRST